jgi:hypothetical protein
MYLNFSGALEKLLTRSVTMTLARRFNAEIRSTSDPRRVATTEPSAISGVETTTIR